MDTKTLDTDLISEIMTVLEVAKVLPSLMLLLSLS